FAPPVEGHPGLGVREFPLAPGATLTRRASVLGRLGVPAEMGTLAPERAWHPSDRVADATKGSASWPARRSLGYCY
ncbi:MAG TPA: hypothetical protein VJY33_11815, partial [Isosphaeraceae bacterium]|nr:hypothetical protein [Isosphaeraceae bacterium]